MRQIDVTSTGELVLAEAPTPTPAEGEVLIKVHSAGVNRADLLQRRGHYALKPGVTPVLGLEVSGTIVTPAGATGAGRWKAGDSVCALLTGGGYAEYAVTPAANCLPVPAGLSLLEAASLPETFFTVWLDVFDLGKLQPGETLLVHGGSSGIGITAIQLAKALSSRVIVTAGSEEKCAACLKIGADVAINYRTTDFETAAKGVNVILDMVGGSYTAKNLRILAPRGRLVYINFMEAAKAEIDLALILGRQLTITGSGLRWQPPKIKAAIAQELETRAWPLIEAGKIKPVIDSVYPLAEARAAHARMDSSAHIGKIMLSVT